MKLRDFFSLHHIDALRSRTKQPQQEKYRHFRALLNHNRAALRHMAELEQIYYSDHPIDARTVERQRTQLREEIEGLVAALNALADNRFAALTDACANIHCAIAALQALPPVHPCGAAVLPLEEIGADMHSRIGGKAAGLALLKNVLRLPVPNGFVITADATAGFLAIAGLSERIGAALAGLSTEDIAGMEAGSAAIRHMIVTAQLPDDLAESIFAAYAGLEAKTSRGVRIAMRSSAVGEDGAASFAGQYTTVLNVVRDDLLNAFKEVVASKYSARAISYRQLLGLADEETPMCVVGLAMVDASASGVLYTLDPETLDDGQIKIAALWGLGEQLVGGDAEPDTFVIEKRSGKVLARRIARKSATLVALPAGGIRLEDTQAERQSLPSLDDASLEHLRLGAERIETQQGAAQDIEWAIDAEGRHYFLQTRPLHLAPSRVPEPDEDLAGLEILLSGGIAASRGIAAGTIHVARDENALGAIPARAILVTPTAAPAYAAVMDRIVALVTDVGSITSHLASVAREFGIPAIMGAGNATAALVSGDAATVVAGNRVAVVRGVPERLRERMRPARKRYVGSPAHKQLRALLDCVVPLHLTDSRAPDFVPSACRSYHDVIRFCHEQGMRAMFDLSADADGAGAAVKVATHLPLAVHVIDLGGGLLERRRTRGSVAPDEFVSAPLQAIWKGLTHPGIGWEGTVNFASSRFLSLMATIATSELGPEPGGDSYALAARDYLNFSAKFGYHFATVDALCVEEASHNYVSMQFAGGAGNYFGRSLRVRFIGTVLERLGFKTELQGDLIEATYSRHGQEATLDRLDQLGRLLASCRLLDMTLADEDAALAIADAFMAGDYDLLKPRDPAHPRNFYTQQGHWSRREQAGELCLYQSGRATVRPDAVPRHGLLGKTIGASYRELVDSIGAYFFFPLAIARNSEMADGTVTVDLMPEGGLIDRAGGLIFGLKNAANYYVFRINALEHNAILFECVDGKRSERGRAASVIRSGRWYRLHCEIAGGTVRCGIDGTTLVDYRAESPICGHIGVWTKADSATWFKSLGVLTEAGARTFDC
jgi:pyruvate,water dikinase